MRGCVGFTWPEVLVALVIFAVGMLGLTAETASLVRALGRARRAEEVTAVAGARLERLRAGGCGGCVDGSEIVRQGATPIAQLDWTWSDLGDSTYAVRIVVAPAPRLAPAFGPGTLQRGFLW